MQGSRSYGFPQLFLPFASVELCAHGDAVGNTINSNCRPLSEDQDFHRYLTDSTALISSRIECGTRPTAQLNAAVLNQPLLNSASWHAARSFQSGTYIARIGQMIDMTVLTPHRE